MTVRRGHAHRIRNRTYKREFPAARFAAPSIRRRLRLSCSNCRVRTKLVNVFCPYCGERVWPLALIVMLSLGFLSLLLAVTIVIP